MQELDKSLNKSLGKKLIALDRETATEYELEAKTANSFVTKDGAKNIEITKNADNISFASIDGVCYPIEVVRMHQNECEMLVNGVSYSFSIETPFSLQRKKMLMAQASQSQVMKLKSPMPGKILDVLVKVGDSVKAGDTLVVLEAMKMQNAILASCKGTVKKVLVKEGETTSKSDLLIEIEKE